jgi:hypothetical protein
MAKRRTPTPADIRMIASRTRLSLVTILAAYQPGLKRTHRSTLAAITSVCSVMGVVPPPARRIEQ